MIYHVYYLNTEAVITLERTVIYLATAKDILRNLRGCGKVAWIVDGITKQQIAA